MNNRPEQSVALTKLNISDVPWTFLTTKEWAASFESLEEALPFLATLTAAERYIWWITGDIAEALMTKFGRTEGVKARIGAIIGCKVRTVENRVRAAALFPASLRYPDVPVRMYMEAAMWDDPVATLQAALESGAGWLDLRLERQGPQMIGPPVWKTHQGTMRWRILDDGRTAYTITIIEEGGARFARTELPVMVTVALASATRCAQPK